MEFIEIGIKMSNSRICHVSRALGQAFNQSLSSLCPRAGSPATYSRWVLRNRFKLKARTKLEKEELDEWAARKRRLESPSTISIRGRRFFVASPDKPQDDHIQAHKSLQFQLNSTLTYTSRAQRETGGMAGKTVAVTGATGFIASYLVKDLLERGYNVRGTVRNPDDVSKVGYLLDLPGAKERLTLCKADLLEEGSFDKVVDGVDGVFHAAIALPRVNITLPQKQFVDPALNGTLNLLGSIAKASSVKRVVLTGSGSSVMLNNKSRKGVVIDESWWSDPEWLREQLARKQQLWFPLSKTLAEKAAWDFVKGKRFDLVVMNPFLVIGTILPPTLNPNSEEIADLVSGTAKTCPNEAVGFVHVKDVSLAHILGYEDPKAEGRYLLAEGVYHYRQIALILRKLYPDYPVCTEPGYELSQEVPPYNLSTEKAKKLGVAFESVETILVDTVTSLQQKGCIKAPIK